MDAVKILGSLLRNNSTGGDILGSLLGGGGASSGAGGAGDLLGKMLGGSAGGGAGDVLGKMLGGGAGGSAGGGGLAAAILGGLLSGRGGADAGAGGGSAPGGGGLKALSETLGGGAIGGDTPAATAQAAPPQDPQQEAEILIRAMCNAAKADGKFDQQEQEKILGRLGDVEQEEIEFIRNELAQPLDVQGFARSIPREAAPQVYAFSVMAIKLDQQSEAQYLGQLAQALGLNPDLCNQIHEQMGAPPIFR